MTITSTALTKAAGICAIAAGIVFMGVQLGHPQLNTDSITTTNVYVRDQLKILMCALALVGITGMYLSQIRKNGLLGLIGYVLFALGYLAILCDVYTAAYVFPHVAGSSNEFVNNVIVLDTSRGTMHGDAGAIELVTQLRGVAYLGGGLIFGIALFRARVLTRWACALLAVGGVISIALSLMPDAFYRWLAFPNSIAMVGLGYSLWRTTRSDELRQSSVTIPAQASRAPDDDISSGSAAPPAQAAGH